MNGEIPQIYNPLDPFGRSPGYVYFPDALTPGFVKARPGQIYPDSSGSNPFNLQGIIQDLQNDISEGFAKNAPTYAVAVFGLLLIGAGVYSLAK